MTYLGFFLLLFYHYNFFCRDKISVSYHRGSSSDRWSGHAAGREVPLIPRETLHTRGGPGRDLCKCMEVQLSKVRDNFLYCVTTFEKAK